VAPNTTSATPRATLSGVMEQDHTTARTVDLTVVRCHEWPLRLAAAHWALPVGAEVVVEGARGERVPDLIMGAGFASLDGSGEEVRAQRLRSLPDTVRRDMRLLVCGLNPSLYAADSGVAYARPGNRFWPAAQEAGLVTRDRDPLHALEAHGVGMTDLVKRATRTAAELTRDEYVDGLARVNRLVEWLQPRAVCFVGLAGYRVAANRHATAGVQPREIGGAPVYVMPSTSGANASASRAQLVTHLRAAADLADGQVT
jgi:double-stranded uracil-DNA glycosylase